MEERTNKECRTCKYLPQVRRCVERVASSAQLKFRSGDYSLRLVLFVSYRHRASLTTRSSWRQNLPQARRERACTPMVTNLRPSLQTCFKDDACRVQISFSLDIFSLCGPRLALSSPAFRVFQPPVANLPSLLPYFVNVVAIKLKLIHSYPISKDGATLV